MFSDLQGKIILVTGAASGIGRACAVLMAKAGGVIIVADKDESGGNETVSIIKKFDGDAYFSQLDITQVDQVEGIVDQILERHGRLDCAVNNAGIFLKSTPLVENEPADFDRIININLKGVFLCMKYEIKAMLKQRAGSIVNISSVQGLVAGAGSAIYCASKHGVIGMTKGAALDNAKTGIRVNAVCPGTIETPMATNYFIDQGLPIPDEFPRIPMGRLGRPEEVANAVMWLCSPGSSYITGISMPVDGALIVP